MRRLFASLFFWLKLTDKQSSDVFFSFIHSPKLFLLQAMWCASSTKLSNRD